MDIFYILANVNSRTLPGSHKKYWRKNLSTFFFRSKGEIKNHVNSANSLPSG